MAKAETALQNFAGGELGPNMRSRWDLPIYQHGFEICRNFIATTQGPARYRAGFRYVTHTRRNNVAALIKFQFSNVQAYVLEFTDGYMRVHRDDGVVLETAKNISAATQANPCVITSNSHGFSNGDEVYISDVVGMAQLNGKFFLVANKTANTFELTDQDGNNVNSTAFTAYSSGGTVARVYEITTPYREADDLFLLRTSQNADTMYMVHPYYEPRKLTRSAHTSWSLALFTRTNDPFLAKKTITAATAANPCVITSNSHGLSNGDIVIIEGVVGMTQLNGRYYTVANVATNTFELSGVNSSAYTAYSSGGYASLRKLLPGAVAFYEARTAYAKIENEPLGFKLSRSPDNNGANRYDDFTNGTDDDHAIENTINAEDESAIRWLRGLDKFLAVGAFSGIFKVTGNTDEEAISPTSIKARRVTSVGSSDVQPLSLENAIVYAEQNNLTLRSFEFDALLDSFKAVDRNLVSDRITQGLIKQFAWMSGRPEIVWVVKENGELLGMTFQSGENVSAWHRHPSRSGDLFLSIATVPRSNNYDRLWAVIEREIDGVTRRYVEYLEDFADIPEPEDFYTGDEEEDLEIFLRAMWEAQKLAYHVDSGVTYDGSSQSVTMTPAAITGDDINFTASASLFKTSDVGRQIWKKAIDGVGQGRAEIVEYVSATVVKCNIIEDFDDTSVMAAGDWFLTTDSPTNLDHLEGETVHVIADGAVHPDREVSEGAISLQYQASVIHIGLRYKGILKTMNLEVGGVNGPSQTKLKNIDHVGFRFHQTIGTKYGANLYNLSDIEFRGANDYTDRPPPLFSGDRYEPVEDSWERFKNIYIVQENGVPCTVQLIEPYANTKNN